MAGLGSVSITDALFKATGCPTDDRCYTGTVLIGDTLTPVTFVLIDETPILVSGGEESQKELPVISDTAGAAEQTDRR